ncbi:hypothetical protein [Mycolicibacter terrae]|nr:hypothetical protein [Mycolicibacter terrae]
MGKRLAAGVVAAVLVALLVNTVVTDRIARAAEPFAADGYWSCPGRI